MLVLNKENIANKIGITNEVAASVCNSCACGTPYPCNSTCKGCNDQNKNIDVKKVYTK